MKKIDSSIIGLWLIFFIMIIPPFFYFVLSLDIFSDRIIEPYKNWTSWILVVLLFFVNVFVLFDFREEKAYKWMASILFIIGLLCGLFISVGFAAIFIFSSNEMLLHYKKYNLKNE